MPTKATALVAIAMCVPVLIVACSSESLPDRLRQEYHPVAIALPRVPSGKSIKAAVHSCFTVAADGSITDIRVKSISFAHTHDKKLDENIKNVSRNRTMEILAHEKFFPRRVDGKAVATANVCQQYRYVFVH